VSDPEWYLDAKRRGLIERETPHLATYAGSPHASPAAVVSEAEFTDAVLALALACGWRRAHFRPARTAKGWRTAMQGEKGFPDLVLVRVAVLLEAELKVGRNKPTADQVQWLAAFKRVQGVLVYEWQPEDWPEIERVLRQDAAASPPGPATADVEPEQEGTPCP